MNYYLTYLTYSYPSGKKFNTGKSIVNSEIGLIPPISSDAKVFK